MEASIQWAEQEIERIKADEHYRPEMTKALEELVRHAQPKVYDYSRQADESCGL